MAEIKEECKLTDLPLGLDIGLFGRFNFDSYPASVVLDRNGVICYARASKIPSKDHFMRLLTPFIGEDYSAPILLKEVPRPVSIVKRPDETELKAALGIEDERLSILPITNSTVWPFVPDDKGGVAASNSQTMSTMSKLTIHVEAGTGAGLSFASNGMYAFLRDGLLDVTVDGERKLSVPGSENWKTNYVALGDTNIAHDVTFTYEAYEDHDEPINIAIKDITVLNAEELDALVSAERKPTNKLTGKSIKVKLISGDAKPIVFTTSDGTSGEDITYRTMDSDLDFRVHVGNEINERIAFVVTYNDAVPLYTLPCDEDGYLIHWTNPGLGFECNTFDVYASIDEDNSIGMMELYDSEATLEKWIVNVNDRYPKAEMDWHYTDGSPKQIAQTDAPVAASLTESTYVIRVTDADGDPLEGVFIKFCDDETCQAIFTDENGVIMQTAAPKTYEVHVLMVPDGFLSDQTAYTMPPEGGDLTIVLNK